MFFPLYVVNLFFFRFLVSQVFASPTVSLCHGVECLRVLYLCVLVLVTLVFVAVSMPTMSLFVVARFTTLSATLSFVFSVVSEGPCEDR